MSRYVDELYRNPGQPGLRALLRGMLKLLFRGLIRPPVPFAVQALVLRLLTLGMPLAKGVSRSAGMGPWRLLCCLLLCVVPLNGILEVTRGRWLGWPAEYSVRASHTPQCGMGSPGRTR